MMFKTVRGMRDFLPEKMRKKKYIEDVCREVFERYGFGPLQTPAVEELGLLTKKGSSGEDIEKEIYAFKDQGGRKLGLRFDLTVPLARVVASNPGLQKPFKRYCIGRVWRYDRPQAQRYREFSQADADIVGVESVIAEFEIIALTIEVFRRLGLDFYVKINNRKLLESLAKSAGVKDADVLEAFRSIDKLDKIGWDGVAKELRNKGIPTDILAVLKKNDLSKIEKELKAKGASMDGLDDLNELLDMLKDNGLDKKVRVELSLARGLDYYTGMVFEVIAGGKWSCGGGGRYDELVESYGGKSTPATGISYGIDRILEIMEEKMKAPVAEKVFVVPVGDGMVKEALKVVQKLRAMGVASGIDLLGRGISKNLNYAGKRGIPFAAILGENELKAGEITLRDMRSGKERKVKLKELDKLKEIVSG